MRARRIFLSVVVAVGLAACAKAKELAVTLLAAGGPHLPGETTRVELVALNPSGQEAPFAAPVRLAGRLHAAGLSWPVVAEATGPAPTLVPAGAFAARAYQLVLPADALGEAVVVFQTDDASALRLALVIEPAVAGRPKDAAGSPPGPVERLVTQATAISTVSRNFTGRFLPNQPVYFLYGDSAPAAKFQFSFDYRLASFDSRDAESNAEVRSLRVGYTQRSLWDLDGESSPFYDTSYMPEFAFQSDRRLPEHVSSAFTWLGWRASLLHESNGRAGDDSRSVNTLYFRPRFVLGKLGDWAFVMLPELQAYLGDSSENADLKDYRGYGKLRFYFGRNDRPTLMFTGWSGTEFEHGSYQLDLAVPLRLQWLKLESYIYVQYFNGYGESLRDYAKRSDALRAGFGLVR